ncbi:hypothetical protein P4E94_12035 [Pontiellaceae bacterium B12219]|nr:hypothetical protein [Pontiellaceae bacterium B12219]
MNAKKRFFSKHTKSSAAVVTLILHAIFIIAGLSLVVMNTIITERPAFVHRAAVRQNIPLRNIRPPSSVRNLKPAKPNFVRVPVNVRVEQKVTDIKLPELQSVKSELGGSAGTGGGALSTIAFSMPELELFNIKGRGEKVFLILDAGEQMLVDEMGGIPAYTIIKQEMVRMLRELPPTAVFNVCVFGNGKTITLFPALVSATTANTRQAEAWLEPLNGAEESASTGRYGIQTLEKGGIQQREDMRVGPFAEEPESDGGGYRQDRWFVPAMVAMQQRADAIFLLTNTWGRQRRVSEKRSAVQKAWFSSSEGKRWLQHIENAKKLLAEENRRRKTAGQPPKVVANGSWGLMNEYYPGTPRPPSAAYYHFTPQEFQEAFEIQRAEKEENLRERLKGRGDRFSFNVIQFVPVSGETKIDGRFKKLTRLCRGGYETVAGLEMIQNDLESD